MNITGTQIFEMIDNKFTKYYEHHNFFTSCRDNNPRIKREFLSESESHLLEERDYSENLLLQSINSSQMGFFESFGISLHISRIIIGEYLYWCMVGGMYSEHPPEVVTAGSEIAMQVIEAKTGIRPTAVMHHDV